MLEDRPDLWSPVFLFAQAYRDYLSCAKPSVNHIIGVLLFATRKPKEKIINSTDENGRFNGQPYAEDLLKKISKLLLENAEIASDQRDYLIEHPFVILDNNVNSEFNVNEKLISISALQKKRDAANKKYTEDGIRPFFITAYASFGAGHNLTLDYDGKDYEYIMTANDASYGRDKISLNYVALDTPTNYIIPNPKSDEERLERALQLIRLYIRGEITPQSVREYLLKPIFRLTGFNSYYAYMLYKMFQAVGRIERGPVRCKTTYITVSPHLKKRFDLADRNVIPEFMLQSSSMSAEALYELLAGTNQISPCGDDQSGIDLQASADFNARVKQAQNVYEKYIKPEPDPKQYQNLCDLIMRYCRPTLTEEEFDRLEKQMGPVISSMYLELDDDLKLSNLYWNAHENDFLIIRGDIMNKPSHSWKYLPYRPDHLAGCEQFRDLKPITIRDNDFDITGIQKFLDTTEGLKYCASDKDIRFVMCPDLAYKYRGCLAEKIFPDLMNYLLEKHQLPYELLIPDPGTDPYERFDFYLQHKQDEKLVIGIDTKNYSKPLKRRDAEETGKKYSQRIEELKLQGGIIVQVFPYWIPISREDPDLWKRIVQTADSDCLNVVGPLLDQTMQFSRTAENEFTVRLNNYAVGKG